MQSAPSSPAPGDPRIGAPCNGLPCAQGPRFPQMGWTEAGAHAAQAGAGTVTEWAMISPLLPFPRVANCHEKSETGNRGTIRLG